MNDPIPARQSLKQLLTRWGFRLHHDSPPMDLYIDTEHWRRVDDGSEGQDTQYERQGAK